MCEPLKLVNVYARPMRGCKAETISILLHHVYRTHQLEAVLFGARYLALARVIGSTGAEQPVFMVYGCFCGRDELTPIVGVGGCEDGLFSGTSFAMCFFLFLIIWKALRWDS
jgi:hypothetical protein